MVKVYFETKDGVIYSELVATFKSDELYMLCLPSLVKEAKKHNMIVVESVI